MLGCMKMVDKSRKPKAVVHIVFAQVWKMLRAGRTAIAHPLDGVMHGRGMEIRISCLSDGIMDLL